MDDNGFSLTPLQMQAASLLLQALDIAFKHDLTPLSGDRSLQGRMTAAHEVLLVLSNILKDK